MSATNEGPDYVGYYTHEIKNLVSQDESNWPISNQSSRLPQDMYDVVKKGKGKSKASDSTEEQNGESGSTVPLFSNGIGALISDQFKKERLNCMLRESARVLKEEVDEMEDHVHRIIPGLRNEESPSMAFSVDQTQQAHKKQKLCPSLGSKGKRLQINVPVKEPSNDMVKKCIVCLTTGTPQWRPAPDGTKTLCNACWFRAKRGKDRVKNYDNLRTILENDSPKVQEPTRKNSSEALEQLQYMEQKLEELLHSVTSSCRKMTYIEKTQVRNLMESLPAKNIEVALGILRYNKPPGHHYWWTDVFTVELVNEDDAILWRLYFYCTSVLSRES